MQEHLNSVVEGENVPFSDEVLSGGVDEKRVRKVYKLNSIGGGGKGGIGKGREKDERRELEVGVLGAMALRSVTN